MGKPILEKQSIADFQNPPLRQVACAVRFKEVNLSVAHIGLLWSLCFDEYPKCEERPFVRLSTETLSSPQSRQGYPMGVRFLNESESNLLDLQSNLLSYSWSQKRSKNPENSSYPRYNQVMENFIHSIVLFDEFCEGMKIGKFEPISYELSYYNEIPKGIGWTEPADLSGILPVFNSAKASTEHLGTPSAVNVQWVYELPNHFNLFAKAITSPKTQKLEFTLTCKGQANSATGGWLEPLTLWFNEARRNIVIGFCDLTDKSVQSSQWNRLD